MNRIINLVKLTQTQVKLQNSICITGASLATAAYTAPLFYTSLCNDNFLSILITGIMYVPAGVFAIKYTKNSFILQKQIRALQKIENTLSKT